MLTRDVIRAAVWEGGFGLPFWVTMGAIGALKRAVASLIAFVSNSC